MKFFGSSHQADEQALGPDRSDSNDVIRSGSIKSGDLKLKTPLEMESSNPDKHMRTLHKHSWANTLGLLLLSALSAAALGIAIWGAVEGVSNSNSIDDIHGRLDEMSSEMSSASTERSLALPQPTDTSDISASTTSGEWPDVLLRRDPGQVQGYGLAGSLYRGSGYWATRPSAELDAPAAHLAAVNSGNMVYITGGRHTLNDGSIYTSDALLRFDAGLGLYGDAESMPQARSAHASAYLNGKVYVIGGYANGEDLVSGKPAGGMFVYDTTNAEWSEGAAPIKPRGRACAAAANGKVYLVGGFKDDQQPTDSIEEYDPATKTWTEVANLPSARGTLGCTAVGNLVYIAGGTQYFSGQTKTGATNEMLVFDAGEGTVKQLAPLSAPRMGLTLVAANDADGSILALGGMMLAANRDTVYQVGNGVVEAYLPFHDTWVIKAPMASPRFALAAVTTGSGAFVFGGNSVCEQDTEKCQSMASVEVFEFATVPDVFVHLKDASAQVDTDQLPQSDVMLTSQHSGAMRDANGADYAVAGSLYQGAGYWAQRDPMPMGHLADFQMIPVANNKGERSGAFLIGGSSGEVFSNETWLFDALLDTWIRQEDMPEPRSRHAATALSGKIYVVGGFSTYADANNGLPARDMLVYDISEGKWSRVDNGPHVPRGDGCAATVDGKIYFAGGYAVSFASILDTVEVYDPEEDSWSTVRPMPTPRGDAMCATLEGRLVVLGGFWDPANNWTANSFRREVEAFDPVSNEWAQLKDMPVARGDMAIVDLPNDRLMVMGGETTDEVASRTMVASNEVYQYIAAQDIWVPKAPMIENRFRFDAAYVGNHVFVFGGQRSSATGGYDDPPPGLASSEAFYYAQVPDVFVWMKVPGN